MNTVPPSARPLWRVVNVLAWAGAGPNSNPAVNVAPAQVHLRRFRRMDSLPRGCSAGDAPTRGIIPGMDAI
jgi:hypothetical protein